MLFYIDEMNYMLMVEDFKNLLIELYLFNVIVIGYLMGGKIVMMFVNIVFELVDRLVVIDIVLIINLMYCYDVNFVGLFVVKEVKFVNW